MKSPAVIFALQNLKPSKQPGEYPPEEHELHHKEQIPLSESEPADLPAQSGKRIWMIFIVVILILFVVSVSFLFTQLPAQF